MAFVLIQHWKLFLCRQTLRAKNIHFFYFKASEVMNEVFKKNRRRVEASPYLGKVGATENFFLFGYVSFIDF